MDSSLLQEEYDGGIKRSQEGKSNNTYLKGEYPDFSYYLILAGEVVHPLQLTPK